MDLSYVIPKVVKKIFNRAAIKKSDIDLTARVDIGSIIVGSKMGRYSYIGEHTSLLDTEVGNYTSISNYCAIGGGGHPIDWVSMSPVFNSSKGIIKKSFSSNCYEPFKKTYIGNDVWIGSHCLIKAGVTVSDGAVVGMGSVVTKDIGPYEIWAGNPAKLIRKRFDDEMIEALQNSEWWYLDDSELVRYADLFNSPAAFLDKYRKDK